MINIFEEITDVECSIDRIKSNQDQILDTLDVSDEAVKSVLSELVSLHQQFEKLEQELIDLSKQAL